MTTPLPPLNHAPLYRLPKRLRPYAYLMMGFPQGENDLALHLLQDQMNGRLAGYPTHDNERTYGKVRLFTSARDEAELERTVDAERLRQSRKLFADPAHQLHIQEWLRRSHGRFQMVPIQDGVRGILEERGIEVMMNADGSLGVTGSIDAAYRCVDAASPFRIAFKGGHPKVTFHFDNPPPTPAEKFARSHGFDPETIYLPPSADGARVKTAKSFVSDLADLGLDQLELFLEDATGIIDVHITSAAGPDWHTAWKKMRARKRAEQGGTDPDARFAKADPGADPGNPKQMFAPETVRTGSTINKLRELYVAEGVDGVVAFVARAIDVPLTCAGFAIRVDNPITPPDAHKAPGGGTTTPPTKPKQRQVIIDFLDGTQAKARLWEHENGNGMWITLTSIPTSDPDTIRRW